MGKKYARYRWPSKHDDDFVSVFSSKSINPMLDNLLSCVHHTELIKPPIIMPHFDASWIQGIYVDEIKKVVAVRFIDGSVEKVKCQKDDGFDPIVGASIAICRKVFGHSKFYKNILMKKTHYTNKEKK